VALQEPVVAEVVAGLVTIEDVVGGDGGALGASTTGRPTASVTRH
jgi:hypothetical protein